MPIVLQGCEHRKVYGLGPDQGTCLSCYQRLRVDFEIGRYVPDVAPGLCQHVSLTPVGQEVNRHQPFYDALCMDCGCVLRHPEAQGKWTPVLDYSFRIREAP